MILAAQAVWLTALVLGLAWVSRRHPAEARALLRDARALRVLYFLLLWAGGFGAASHWRPRPPAAGLALELALTAVGFLLAVFFSLTTNNIADLEIDRISNRDRPLVTHAIALDAYARASRRSLVLALVTLALAGPEALLGVGAFTAGYYVYSCPPFRLKRVLVLSKLPIAAGSLALIMLGFVQGGGSWRAFLQWRTVVAVAALTMASNFIDLKDVDGDRAGGIVTLPVLIGREPTQWILAATALVGAPIFAWLALRSGPWMLAFAAVGIVLGAMFARRPYREPPVLVAVVSAIVLALAAMAVQGR